MCVCVCADCGCSIERLFLCSSHFFLCSWSFSSWQIFSIIWISIYRAHFFILFYIRIVSVTDTLIHIKVLLKEILISSEHSKKKTRNAIDRKEVILKIIPVFLTSFTESFQSNDVFNFCGKKHIQFFKI